MTVNTSRLSSKEALIVEAAQSMGITDPVELAQLLAQLKTESNLELVDETLRYSAKFLFEKFPYNYIDKKGKPRTRSWGFKSEAEAQPLCCGKDRAGLANRIYGSRLGNNNPGDGFRYRGRGYIQLTGKATYADVGRKLGIDLVNNPDLVLDPRYASKVAIQIFWKDRVRPQVSSFSDTVRVTLAVNGGSIGLAERKAHFKYYSDKLGLGTVDTSQPSTTPNKPPTNTPAPVPRPVVPPTTQPTSIPIQGSSPQQPISNYGEYIQRVYKIPFASPLEVSREVLNPIQGPTSASIYFRDYLGSLRGVDYSKNTLDYLVVIDTPDLNNDFLLIDSLTKQIEKQKEEVKNLLDNKLGTFSPDAKYALVQSKLFEMNPDDMRKKMSINSKSTNPTYSHAWRAPGKVSITADITIPGISGLRIGQIFWVDKISRAYKEYGAFQLFSLTENIDISKGWTTSIHSRFNVLPRRGSQRYLTDEINDGNTAQKPTEATPQS